MYSGGEEVRGRWSYPRDNERNVVGAVLHLGAIVATTTALVQFEWFRLGGSGARALRCVPTLALHQFFKLGYFGHTTFTNYNNLHGAHQPDPPPVDSPAQAVEFHTGTQVLRCVTPNVLNLMRTLIMLCMLCVFCSMIGFCLDVMGPTKKTLRFVRRNALPGIWTVVTVVTIVGVSYLVSRALEHAIDEMGPTMLPVHVTYEYGFYAITAAGVISLLATACNLLQDPAPPDPSQRHRLIDDLDGLETFSVGMQSLPPPPPYTP